MGISSLGWRGNRTVSAEEPLPCLGCMSSMANTTVKFSFLLYILCSMSLCLNVGRMNRRSLSCAVFSTLGHAEEQEKDFQSFATTSLANI